MVRFHPRSWTGTDISPFRMVTVHEDLAGPFDNSRNLTVDYDDAIRLVLDTDPADIDRHLAKISSGKKAKFAKN